MTDLTDLGAAELSASLEAGKFSSVELMTAYLDRIDAINPTLNAVVALRPREALLDEARAADQCPRRGWLQGIPMAVKDLAETHGLCTTYGSPLFAKHVPNQDCRLVSRLRDAGAIIIGKTNTPEFGLGSHTYNPVYGVTRNPYDTHLSAGGSSGGAAAALAARLVPVADGSDMMGSLRNPAAFNNIYGFRPSAGLIPDDQPADACQLPLATSGPMGRTIIDMAMLLDTLVEHDPTQPWCLPRERSFTQALLDEPLTPGQSLQPGETGSCGDAPVHSQALEGKRIGWIADANGHYPMEGGLLAHCANALDLFRQLGSEVSPVQLPFDLQSLFDAWCTLRSYSIAWALRPLYEDKTRRAMLKPEAIWEIERGRITTGQQLHTANQIRSTWFACAARLLQQFDALCLPSAAVYPFDATIHWPDSINGSTMTTYHEWMKVVVPASMAGLPTLAIPAGFNDAGLPAGLQLMGCHGNDLAVLQLGQAYHLASDWPNRQPPDLSQLAHAARQ